MNVIWYGLNPVKCGKKRKPGYHGSASNQTNPLHQYHNNQGNPVNDKPKLYLKRHGQNTLKQAKSSNMDETAEPDQKSTPKMCEMWRHPP